LRAVCSTWLIGNRKYREVIGPISCLQCLANAMLAYPPLARYRYQQELSFPHFLESHGF
jgi:hypothetical protein